MRVLSVLKFLERLEGFEYIIAITILIIVIL